MASRTVVGILALQGGFHSHAIALNAAGAKYSFIRKSSDVDKIDALVLPGGESTVMLRLLEEDPDLWNAIAEFLNKGKPCLATCAGCILLAKVVHPTQKSFRILDVALERNAYGRQNESCIVTTNDCAIQGRTPLEMIFIRAPRILFSGSEVRVLATRDGVDPTLVRQGNVIAATFHPELSTTCKIHDFFVNVVVRQA